MDVAVLFFDRLKVDDPVVLQFMGLTDRLELLPLGFATRWVVFGGGTSLLITQIISVKYSIFHSNTL